jgi:hypothetical protein
VLSSSEDAHVKRMSAFEADEHAQATPPPSAPMQVSKMHGHFPAALNAIAFSFSNTGSGGENNANAQPSLECLGMNTGMGYGVVN